MFNRDNFEQNNQINDPKNFQELSETKHIWQIPFVCETYDEDNDTDGEISDEDT